MRSRSLLSLVLVAGILGCAPRWVYLTEIPTTKFYMDPESAVLESESVWVVTERFLNPSTRRWYLEAEVRYDCQARTFMTLKTRGFSEIRPPVSPVEVVRNVSTRVEPGSSEEARLEAVCAYLRGGRSSPTP